MNHTQRTKLILFTALLFTLAACNLSGTQPPQPSVTLLNENISILFEIGENNTIETSAIPNGLTSQALDFSLVGTSKGLTDKGGMRYLYGTFEVTNTSNETFDNLSFYALTTGRALGGTALGSLKNARNEAITDATFARTILPTHRMESNSGRLEVKADEADFQGLSDAQVSAAQRQLSAGSTVLGYGFTARNAGGGRAIAPGQTGFVTFAVKFPFDPNSSAEYPFAFTLSFAAVDDSVRQVTRSAEESANSARDVCARGDAINAERVVVISQHPNSAPCNLTLLTNVKTAIATNGEETVYLLPDAPTTSDIDVKINFQLDSAPVPNGFVKDSGQAYGAQANGTYGWLKLKDDQPVDASGAARDRNRAGVAQERDTVIHLQRGDCCDSGFTDEVYWEYALPNGTYQVTVSAGDEPAKEVRAGFPNAYDSKHTLNVESVPALSKFQADSDNEFEQSTVIVQVEDGKLTIDAVGGINTKINYVFITSTDASAAQHPFVTSIDPANGATDLSPNTATITAGLSLPNGGVALSTLDGNVTLTNLDSGANVSGTPDTSGGADTISFKISEPLEENTSYRFEVSSGAEDESGASFLPFASTFTTGTLNTNAGPVAFTKTVVDEGQKFTSVTIGPDSKLYASTAFGSIYRYQIERDGNLTEERVIDTVKKANGGAPRTIIGLTFDPIATADNLILWVSDNVTYMGSPDVPDWTGKIAKLTGSNLQNYEAVIEGLPRSVRDHETNSIAFGPDGALYVSQGSNNAMGAPDSAWGNREERLLSAAVLRLDLDKLPSSLPLNVKTNEGGSYNPFAKDAPLTVYASGIRNAYDLVWHSNGRLYVPTNGSAPGGNAPATPSTLPASCNNRIDADRFGAYTRTNVPRIDNNSQRELDYLFRVSEGRYYGHPNPARCEWVLNAGNVKSSNDPFEANDYPLGTQPDRNYDADGVFNAGLSASANGVIEYMSGTFGGALKGQLLNVRYSKERDIQTFSLDSSGSVTKRVTGTDSNIDGFSGFNGPLDIVEDLNNGNLYVADFGPQSLDVAGRIVLLTPRK